jgi:hypothetical protein
MKRPLFHYFHPVLILACVLAVTACSFSAYRPQPDQNEAIVARAVTQEAGAFTVRASVPGAEEAEKIFDFPIYDRGIQPVWLEIKNNSRERARFVHVSVDDEYFSPLEVAYMHKKRFSKEGWQDMERFLMENAIPRQIDGGATVSGYIFTHLDEGTKAFDMDIFYSGNEARYEQLTFFIAVPGFVPDHAELRSKDLYPEHEVQDVDLSGLKTLLESMPCCTTNRDGSGQGQPVNVSFVAEPRKLLKALLRAGWSETSYKKDDIYLNTTDYLFGRPPDTIFRKNRSKSNERNKLGLWVAPVRVNGEPLWMAQLKHSIGQPNRIAEFVFGFRQDPDVDDGRNFLLQDLWYSQSLEEFAYSETGLVVDFDEQLVDFNDNSFFTDGTRITIWISGEPVSLGHVRNNHWMPLK